MAIATKQTLLSLDQFAEVMAISPFVVNQLDINRLGVSRECGVWFQYSWQDGDSITREVAAYAISEAEHMIAEALGYWPAPRFTTGESIPYPRPYPAEFWDVWYNERWKLNSVRTHYGLISSVGAQAHGAIDDDAAVVLSDTDGDGYNDWFTAGPVPTGVTSECDIGVYFRDADRPVSMPMDEEAWRIRPVKVVISGGNVTVSGSLWKLVDPALLLIPGPVALDPTDPANFVNGVKIQRHYVDTGDQGTCSLEHAACNGAQCSNIEVDACFGIRNAKRGVLIPEATEASWPLGAPNCCSGNCYYAPDFVTVNYLSGKALNLSGGVCRMEHVMAQIVARLAVTLIPERFCGECLEPELDYWRALPSEDEMNAMSLEDSGNPFGVRRGALWAWKQVNSMNYVKRAGAFV